MSVPKEREGEREIRVLTPDDGHVHIHDEDVEDCFAKLTPEEARTWAAILYKRAKSVDGKGLE